MKPPSVSGRAEINDGIVYNDGIKEEESVNYEKKNNGEEESRKGTALLP